MIFECAFKDGTGGKEVYAIALESTVDEIAHVDVVVATVENSFALLGFVVWSVSSDVSSVVGVLFLKDPGMEWAFEIFDIFLFEFIDHLFFAFEKFDAEILSVFMLLVCKDDGLEVTVSPTDISRGGVHVIFDEAVGNGGGALISE